MEGDDTHAHFGQNVICRSSVLHFPLERWAGSTPLDGERETTSFKSIGRSERKRKDFYSPIYTYSELKPTVLLAVLLLMVRGKQLHSSLLEEVREKEKTFVCLYTYSELKPTVLLAVL